MTPSCSPVDPIMTRTSRARIRPFTRICGCRLDQSPQRRSGSAPRRRVIFIAIPSVRIRKRQSLFLRHGCDSPQRSARIKVRKPKRSCRQQFRTGKIKLLTANPSHKASRSPDSLEAKTFATTFSIPINFSGDHQSALCGPRTQRRRPASNRLSLSVAQV